VCHREVKLIKEDRGGGETRAEQMRWRSSPMTKAPVSRRYANTAPDLPPEPGVHATRARYEYKRHGTVSFAGRPIRSAHRPGHHPRRDRHRSREFIEFLKILDAAYPAHTAIS